MQLSQQLYKAWVENRYTSGTLPADYTYTGQYSYASDFGLVFYSSRFYDPLLSRWAKPDSIIPQNQGTQVWVRYTYVNNSPVRFVDLTGHALTVDDGGGGSNSDLSNILKDEEIKDKPPEQNPDPPFDASLRDNNTDTLAGHLTLLI